ncbi:hypothetical protein ABPG74_022332 [Tetrahymena malaccensis]
MNNNLDASQSQSNQYKYRKNSTLYFKSKFKSPPHGIFDQITPSYGLGVGIYFDLIQQLFGIFVVIFLVSIGCLYLNINANGIYGEFKLELDVLTLANMPIILTSSPDTKSDSQMRMNIYYIIDCAYTIIFFIYLIYARVSTYKKIAKIKEISDSIKYFTVQVTGFPESIINAYEIKNHFEQLNDHKFNVVECILQRNYQDTLKYQRQKLDLQQQLEIELNRSDLLQEKTAEEVQIRDEKLEQLKLQIQEVDEIIKKYINTNLSNEELSSVKAFVTFSNRRQRKYAISLYENWGGVQDPSLKYKNMHALSVYKAEDPSCIIWENQDSTLPDIYAYKCLSLVVGIIFTILVLITFLIFSSYYKDTWRVDQYTCISNQTMQKSDPRYEQCVCMPNSSFKQDPNVSCQSSYSVSVPNTIFGLIMSIFLFFIRIFMEICIIKEKHNSVIQKEKSIFLSLFFWTSLNSILFIFFFHFTFGTEPVSLLQYFSYIIPPFKNSQDVMLILFPFDIDRNWIINVGYKITLISLFNSLFPQIVTLAINLSVEWFKEQKQEKKRIDFIIDGNPNLNLRKDHPELNKNTLFSLPDRYAQLAFTCYLGFIFAGPIPILLLVASLSLSFQVFFDRYMLIRYNSFDVIKYQRLEVEYSKLAIHFLKWMPWCIVLHLLFSVYCFASPSIFPNIQALNIILTDSQMPNKFVQRLAKSIILSGLLGVILLILFFTDLLKCNKCLKKKKKQDTQIYDEEKVNTQDVYINCLKNIQDQGKLITYDISENEDYVDIIDLINQEFQKISHKNKLEEISKDQIEIYVNQMAENLNQQNLQNTNKFPQQKSNIFQRDYKQIYEKKFNPNSSQIHESNIKLEQPGLDNSIVNPNNLSQIQNNEEDPIINQRHNQSIDLGKSKEGYNQSDSQKNFQGNQQEESQIQNLKNVRESENSSPKKDVKERKKKKKLKLADNEIQNLIKDYQ